MKLNNTTFIQTRKWKKNVSIIIYVNESGMNCSSDLERDVVLNISILNTTLAKELNANNFFSNFPFSWKRLCRCTFQTLRVSSFFIKFIQLLEKLFNICRIIVNKSSSAIKTYTYRNFSERTRTKCSNLLLLRKLYKNKSWENPSR